VPIPNRLFSAKLPVSPDRSSMKTELGSVEQRLEPSLAIS
jgi:hypothetical protein